MMFVASNLGELEDSKVILTTLQKFIKEEEQNLWIQRFV